MREEEAGSKSRALDSSNIGFQLLKKFGWKEGTGLGASEQGRLEPVQAEVKKNKSGIGAEKKKKRQVNSMEYSSVSEMEKDKGQSRKKPKAMSKRLKKMLQEEEQMKEKEFDRAFFREFWPENV